MDLEGERDDFLNRRKTKGRLDDDRKRDPVIIEEYFHSVASTVAAHMSGSSGTIPPKLITYTLWNNFRMGDLLLLLAYNRSAPSSTNASSFFDGS